MPNYVYLCDECRYTFEIYESIHAMSQTHCPSCGCDSLFRVLFAVDVAVKGEPRTIGALADANAKAMGRELVQKRSQEIKDMNSGWYGETPGTPVNKSEHEVPWWRKKGKKEEAVDTSLAKMSPEQKHKYIMEGKKPIL